MYKKSLCIFRRDFRIKDNNNLINCLENSEKVIFAFIFNEKQITSDSLRNNNSLFFLTNCLIDLSKKIKNINVFVGDEKSIIEDIIKKEKINSIFETRDYTEYAKNRSNQIKLICDYNGINYINDHDYLILKPGSVMSNFNTPYKVFTPFYRKFIEVLSKLDDVCKDTREDILELIEQKSIKMENKSIISNFEDFMKKYGIVNEGNIDKSQITREYAIKLLKNSLEIKDYSNMRNFLINKTSELSCYLKFGLISMREYAKAIKIKQGIGSDLLRQLIWREFWYHFHSLIWNRDFGLCFNSSFQHFWKMDENKIKLLDSWKNGKTGIAIVDACMNQLNTEGTMHNRGRMIVASYLIKNLDIDWRLGERYFATKLYDYDPIVNHWSWQWVAGCGTDAAPYYRIFNPMLQSEKFDNNFEYVNKYVNRLNYNENDQIEKIKFSAKNAKDKYENFFSKTK